MQAGKAQSQVLESYSYQWASRFNSPAEKPQYSGSVLQELAALLKNVLTLALAPPEGPHGLTMCRPWNLVSRVPGLPSTWW